MLLCGVAVANHENAPAENWQTFRNKNLAMGIEKDLVEGLIATCRKNDWSAKECDAMLCPVYAAFDEALPMGCVLIKVEEGIAKKADASTVAATAEKRLAYLRYAKRLVSETRCEMGGDQQHLVMHVCMALESGLPESVLEHIFSRPGGYRYGRMNHVVEAGESLQLAGLAPHQIELLLNDFLERDLNRAEIFRAVDLTLSECQKGRPFDDVHRELWIQP